MTLASAPGGSPFARSFVASAGLIHVAASRSSCSHVARRTSNRPDAVSAVNRIARFVEGAQCVTSILASAPATFEKCSASSCFGPAARFGSRRRTVSTGEPSARNSAIRAHSNTAVIAEPAILTVACLPESAIGRSPSYTAARFARLRELFEREGIKFAHREVTVRIADQEAGKPPGRGAEGSGGGRRALGRREA